MNLDKIAEISGRAAGIVGVVLCLIAGIQRTFGDIPTRHFIMGFEVGTVFLAGIALMVFYCAAKLHVLGAKG